MLRLFLTSTHTSSLFAALYAKETAVANTKDILILDAVKKKASLAELIKQSAIIYSWHQILDFSLPLSDSTNIKPSFSKKITRFLKTKPIIKNIYNFLLSLCLCESLEFFFSMFFSKASSRLIPV